MAIRPVESKLDAYSLSWGLDEIWDNEVRAVTLCQRAIRRFLATKQMGRGTADTMVPQMRHWKEQGIARFPCVPLLSLDPDPKRKDALVAGCDEKTKAVVAKFLSPPVLRKIDFPQFLSAFQSSLHRSLQFLMTLPLQDRGYIIIVDEREKSNSWMVSLTLKQLADLPPIDVVYRGDIGQVINNKAIRHIFLMDDASYSGNQIASALATEILPHLERCTHIKALHLVIPFITERAEQKIGAQERYSKTCFLSSHERMPLICQLPQNACGIKASDLSAFTEFLEVHCQLAKGEVLERTLTYFDHKIADYLSTPGKLISEVVGEIIPPYRSEYESILNQCASDPSNPHFITLQFQGKYFVVPRRGCEKLCIVRNEQKIPLLPLEMFELKLNDLVILKGLKLQFDGQKFSI